MFTAGKVGVASPQVVAAFVVAGFTGVPWVLSGGVDVFTAGKTGIASPEVFSASVVAEFTCAPWVLLGGDTKVLTSPERSISC